MGAEEARTGPPAVDGLLDLAVSKLIRLSDAILEVSGACNSSSQESGLAT